MNDHAYRSVLQFAKMLRQVDAWLDKSAAHATLKGFDVNVLAAARLAPDMYALTRQVGSACDAAKFAAAYLADVPPPSHPDTETTIVELQVRIRNVLAFLEGLGADQFENADAVIVRPGWARGKSLPAPVYLREVAEPNFYFHVVTAYGILRHSGVPLGKIDFLGPIVFQD